MFGFVVAIDRARLQGTSVSPAHNPELLDTLDGALDLMFVVKMDGAADVTGGGTTQTVGFQLQDVNREDVAAIRKVEFVALKSGVPANATLASESAGDILGGGGTAALRVETDANGKFTCILTNPDDDTVELTCGPSLGSPLLHCTEVDLVAFSA